MVGSQTKQPKPELLALVICAENPEVFPAALCSTTRQYAIWFSPDAGVKQCRATAPQQEAEADDPGPECCLSTFFCNSVSACEKPIRNSAQAAL
jgi:hypothetical protein